MNQMKFLDWMKFHSSTFGSSKKPPSLKFGFKAENQDLILCLFPHFFPTHSIFPCPVYSGTPEMAAFAAHLRQSLSSEGKISINTLRNSFDSICVALFILKNGNPVCCDEEYLCLTWSFHWTKSAPQGRTAEDSWTLWDIRQKLSGLSSRWKWFHCWCMHLKIKMVSEEDWSQTASLKKKRRFRKNSASLTASKPERTGVTVHGEIHQPHRTLCADCQSESKNLKRKSGQIS